MTAKIRINPNFDGNSKLILKLFGDGIENGALLHRQLIRRAYNCLRSLENAEDAVQDFYLTFSRRAGSGNYLIFELTEDLDVNTHVGFRRLANGSFSKYLVDKYRKAKLRKIKLESEMGNKDSESVFLELLVTNENNPDIYAIKREETEILKSRVNQLPKREKEIIILHYYQELSIKETSIRLRIPVGTVKSRLYKSLESLRTAQKAG